jgi:xanthine/uracil permease
MSQNKATATASATASGVGVGGLLLVAFVVLKLTHLIDWSWWWVLAPAWIPAAILIVVGLVLVAVAVIKTASDR